MNVGFVTHRVILNHPMSLRKPTFYLKTLSLPAFFKDVARLLTSIND